MPDDLPSWTQTGGSLDEVNGVFHDAYERARDISGSQEPVLIFLGEVLILRRGNARTERTVTPPSFHAIRSAAHAPVGLFVALHHLPEKAVPPDILERVRKNCRGLERSLQRLEEEVQDEKALPDVREVLEHSVTFCHHLERARTFARSELDHFARESGPRLLKLTEHGTRIALAALHEGTEALLREIPREEQAALRVFVAGAHQARDRSFGMQYFRRRLREGGHEDRVTYAENAPDEDAVMTLVGTQRLDRDLAHAFFGDAKRLQRDVLGDAAQKQLQ